MQTKICCPICQHEEPSMRELVLHILIWCLLRNKPNEKIMSQDGFMHRVCFCGKKFSCDMIHHGEDAIKKMRTHLCGRTGAGVTEEAINMDDIRNWTCYHDYLMGIKDA